MVPAPLHEALSSRKSSHSCRHFTPGLTASQSWASASSTSQKEGSPGFSLRGLYLNLSPYMTLGDGDARNCACPAVTARHWAPGGTQYPASTAVHLPP